MPRIDDYGFMPYLERIEASTKKIEESTKLIQEAESKLHDDIRDFPIQNRPIRRPINHLSLPTRFKIFEGNSKVP
jgi:hypothetical protein